MEMRWAIMVCSAEDHIGDRPVYADISGALEANKRMGYYKGIYKLRYSPQW